MESVGECLTIYGGSLTSLSGLNSINFSNCLELIDLPELTNLESLESLDVNSVLVRFTGITSFDGFGATSLSGDLRIEHNHNLIDLNGLENLEYIAGKVSIYSNNNLESLAGFGVGHVGSDFKLSGNSLINLTGLEHLEFIDGSVFISGSHLESLVGFGVEHVGGAFKLSGNSLINLTGLEQLEFIDGNVFISGSDIENFTGFGVKRVGGNFKIIESSLSTLAGLENLTEVEGCLYIGQAVCYQGYWEDGREIAYSYIGSSGNSALLNLSGLNRLETVGCLEVTLNPSLTSLEGLESLEQIDGDLQIVGNNVTNVDVSNLSYIGGNLIIGEIERFVCGDDTDCDCDFREILANPSITSLSGLESLTTVCGEITVSGLEDSEVTWLTERVSVELCE